MSERTTDHVSPQPDAPAAADGQGTMHFESQVDTNPETFILGAPPEAPSTRSANKPFGFSSVSNPSLGFSVTPPDSETYPQLFGADYELLGELARGGMGVVYRARQLSLDRIVALKMILGQQRAGTTTQRFIQEAKATAALDHPNIVPIFDCGEFEGRLYFTMPFVKGSSLRDYVEANQPLPISSVVSFFVQIVAGMAQAHRQNIIHRDLKPANILVDLEGRPRIADFGLAKMTGNTDPDRLNMTGTGVLMGTPAFMSPEQARDSKEVTPASDVYSLGCILFHLLTGRGPFVSETLPDLLIQVVSMPPPFPREFNPSTPEDLQAVCMNCLAKSPTQRYPHAMALAEALAPLAQKYCTQSSLHRAVSSDLNDSISYDEGNRTVPIPALSGRPKRIAPPWLYFAMPLLLAALVAGTVYLWPKPDAQKMATEVAKGTTTTTVGTEIKVENITWPQARGEFGVKVELKAAAKNNEGVLQLANRTPLELQVQSEIASWLYVFVVDQHDNAILLFPNEYESDNKMKPGITRVIPSDPAYSLKTTPTDGAGFERVRVVATTVEQPELQRGRPLGKFREIKENLDKAELTKALRQLRGIELVPNSPSESAKNRLSEAELRFRVD